MPPIKREIADEFRGAGSLYIYEANPHSFNKDARKLNDRRVKTSRLDETFVSYAETLKELELLFMALVLKKDVRVLRVFHGVNERANLIAIGAQNYTENSREMIRLIENRIYLE